MRMETAVTSLTTGIVPTGTQPTSSLHWRSTSEGVVGTTMSCTTPSMAEMHAVGSKTGTERKSAWNKNSVSRGTMIIMVPIMTILTGSAPLKEGIIQEESKVIPAT
jgi:Na+/glutamate symporter